MTVVKTAILNFDNYPNKNEVLNYANFLESYKE